MKTEISFPGGTTIAADVTKPPKRGAVEGYAYGSIAVHKPLGGGKGYVLTDIESLRCIVRTRLKRDALEVRKLLEAASEERFQEIVLSFWEEV